MAKAVVAVRLKAPYPLEGNATLSRKAPEITPYGPGTFDRLYAGRRHG
jgi:hypothetical protein